MQRPELPPEVEQRLRNIGTADAVPSRLRAVNGRTISSGAEAPKMAKHLTSEWKLRP
jgi:hypothetical protein